LNPFFLLAGALLFVEKIREGAALFWFGSRDFEILQIFYSRTAIQRTIVNFPAFLEHGSAEKLAVCAHIRTSTRLDNFCMKWPDGTFKVTGKII
jgi:hypothetical protein